MPIVKKDMDSFVLFLKEELNVVYKEPKTEDCIKSVLNQKIDYPYKIIVSCPDKETQEIVKKVMLQTVNTQYAMSYKTGLSYKKNGQAIAWVIGWIEENKHPYFFVLQMEGGANVDLKKARLSVLNAILKEQGFFEGKR
jgi:hypothetical protein